MPPVNHLISLKTPTEFPTLQGLCRYGSAILLAHSGELKYLCVNPLLVQRELYWSSVGVLEANVDIEAAATRLVLLSNKIRDSTTTTSDDALKRLCESCSSTADELLAALNTVKAEGKKDKWESIRKALRSVEEVSKLTLAHLKRYNHLNMATRGILDAILKHQDVFEAVYETQAATIRASHNEVVSRLETEHTTARLDVIRETALIIKDEHVRTRNVLQEIQLILQHILVPLTILLALVSRLYASSQQIYNVLLEMRLTRFVDTRWRFF
ncbi:uncharacterized protein BDR25DRAFT_311904 [Lindgomyces ingoldianus]|uniref:Uncharacterized protein n=1 Tax=Lindgomyces ingoldianus TaxID=673940 RepID=A0ACB6R5W6_9PLEO|nr:uncharacterized protein BDR25DRAFT_311904 [Lindgomyces ingoldianus]KAF2473705.1 hypothetical protein BDR25DRAFT_311904 [Lindgomyces ingoldianus]